LLAAEGIAEDVDLRIAVLIALTGLADQPGAGEAAKTERADNEYEGARA